MHKTQYEQMTFKLPSYPSISLHSWMCGDVPRPTWEKDQLAKMFNS